MSYINNPPLLTVPDVNATIQVDYPTNYLSYNTLTKPSTFTKLTINTDGHTNLPQYDQSYTAYQQKQLQIGQTIYDKYIQAKGRPNPYIGLYCSNMSVPVEGKSNFLTYAE